MAGYEEESRTSGLSAEEVAAREARLFDAVITVDGYPSLRRAIDAGVFTSEPDPFDFGFERGLDGLEAYIDRVARERSGALTDPPAEDPASQGGRGSGSSSDDAEDSSVISDDDPDVVADKKFREAQKAVKQAQKVLAEARKRERQTLREAKERVAKRR